MKKPGKVPLNTALLVAILLLQMTEEPPRIEAASVRIVPAVAEKIPAAPEKSEALKSEALKSEALAPAAATAAAGRTIAPPPDFGEPLNDPAAYYKKKQRHLRAALMMRAR